MVVYCGNSSLAPVISSNISGVKLHGRLDVIGVAAALVTVRIMDIKSVILHCMEERTSSQ